jgi:hypothetical protein
MLYMLLGKVTISAFQSYSTEGNSSSGGARAPTGENPPAKPAGTAETDAAQQLTPDQKQQVAKLQVRDKEVKAHEAAHVAAGGGFVRGGAKFSYETGPDGNRYAVGGEVSIDTSPVKDNPEATIAKMQTVRSAALAPANPSGQDRSVAAAATSQEVQARQEVSKKNSAPSGGQPDKPEGRKAAPVHTGYDKRGTRPEAGNPAASSRIDVSA